MVVEKQAINKTKNIYLTIILSQSTNAKQLTESVCGVSIFHWKFLFALNNQHLYARYTKPQSLITSNDTVRQNFIKTLFIVNSNDFSCVLLIGQASSAYNKHSIHLELLLKLRAVVALSYVRARLSDKRRVWLSVAVIRCSIDSESMTV